MSVVNHQIIMQAHCFYDQQIEDLKLNGLEFEGKSYPVFIWGKGDYKQASVNIAKGFEVLLGQLSLPQLYNHLLSDFNKGHNHKKKPLLTLS